MDLEGSEMFKWSINEIISILAFVLAKRRRKVAGAPFWAFAKIQTSTLNSSYLTIRSQGKDYVL